MDVKVVFSAIQGASARFSMSKKNSTLAKNITSVTKITSLKHLNSVKIIKWLKKKCLGELFIFFHFFNKFLPSSQQVSSFFIGFFQGAISTSKSFLCWLSVSCLLAMSLVFVQGLQLFNWHWLLDWLQLGTLPWVWPITWPKVEQQCANFFPNIWLLPSLIILLSLLIKKTLWPAMVVGVILSCNFWLNTYIAQCEVFLNSSSPSSQFNALDFFISPFDFSLIMNKPSMLLSEDSFAQKDINKSILLFFLGTFCLVLFLQSIGIARQVGALLALSPEDRSGQSLYWILLKAPFVILIYGIITSVLGWWLLQIPANQLMVWLTRWLTSNWLGCLILVSPYIVWKVEQKLDAPILSLQKNNIAVDSTRKRLKYVLPFAWIPFISMGVISGIGLWFGSYVFHQNQVATLEKQAQQFSKKLQQRLDNLNLVALSLSSWYQPNLHNLKPDVVKTYLERVIKQENFDLIEAVSIQPRFQSVRFNAEDYPRTGLGYFDIFVQSEWRYVNDSQMAQTNFDRRDIRRLLREVSASGNSVLFYDSINRVGNASIKYIVPVVERKAYQEQDSQMSLSQTPLSQVSLSSQKPLSQTLRYSPLHSELRSNTEGFLVFSLSLERMINQFFLADEHVFNPRVMVEDGEKRRTIFGGQHLKKWGEYQDFNVKAFDQTWSVTVFPAPVYHQLPYQLFLMISSFVWMLLSGLALTFLFHQKLHSLRLQYWLLKQYYGVSKQALLTSRDKSLLILQQENHWAHQIERPLEAFLKASAQQLRGDADSNSGVRGNASSLSKNQQKDGARQLRSHLLALHLAAWQLMVNIRSAKQRALKSNKEAKGRSKGDGGKETEAEDTV